MITIPLILESRQGRQPFSFSCQRMFNAGYVGRNQEEVRHHVEELAAAGIPGPRSIPTLYPVVTRMLVTDEAIEVYEENTCGEVEYVLLIEDERRIYVGLGSDHTDRHLEHIDIPRAKVITPNVLSRTVWPLEEVLDHWDDLVMKSTQTRDGQVIPYQEGALKLILDHRALMDFVQSKAPGPLNQTVIFSGTLGNLTGGFVYGQRFEAELVDVRLGRRLTVAYDIRPLSYKVTN